MALKTEKSINILIIEDNAGDTILAINALKQDGFEVTYERVETPEDFRQALENKHWDCILSDYSLPRFTGLDALKIYKEEGCDIPFILISGAIGEEIAVKAMKSGVHDYVMKDNLKRLSPVLSRELKEAENRRQKKQAEKNLEAERNLLRTLIDHMPDLIEIKNAEAKKVLANRAVIQFAGYEKEEDIIGKTEFEVFKNDYGKRSHASDLMVLQTGSPMINFEEQIQDASGNERWFLMYKIPLRNSTNKITGVISIAHDITERKKMEVSIMDSEQNMKKQNLEYEALNKQYILLNEDITNSLERIKRMNDELIRSKNRAEESDKLKSAFLANMSHEIRTPLNAILGFSSFLKNKELAENRTEEFVDIIEASGKQLLSTINDILEISQIVAGQISINEETVNITKLLNELFIQFKKEASLKNLELVLNINNSADEIYTRTDAARIRQILSNLLNNAIKFTHEGKIEFAARVANNQVIFYVKDTGIGIDPENHEAIFEQFRQVENTMTRNYGGNGLGLSISKALVEKLGGKMSVNSVPNKGSTFTFTIPFVPDKKDLSRHKETSEGEYNWKQHVILVVEDEIYNFRYIEEMLLPTSAKVLHAQNGVEAVEMVKNHPEISVVLMDLKLPEMDGYKATEIIKKMKPELPVIAQTAFVSTNEDLNKVKNAQFDRYVSKPIEAKKFMEVIDNYLD